MLVTAPLTSEPLKMTLERLRVSKTRNSWPMRLREKSRLLRIRTKRSKLRRRPQSTKRMSKTVAKI